MLLAESIHGGTTMGIRRSHKRHELQAKPANDKLASVEAERSTSPADLPEELIANRAYEKWQLRGCPMGQDGSQDWYEAREELISERLNWAAPREDDAERSTGK
jgi:hypothetical protein